jgi:hypothetical protein
MFESARMTSRMMPPPAPVSMARSGPHNHKGDAPDSTATITPITENIISPESGQEHTRDGKRDGADDVDDENHGWPQRSTVSHFVRPRRSAVVDK